MADPVDKPTEDVKAFDRLGNKIMVPQDQVADLEELGGRVATSKELKQAALDAEYDKHTTAEKAAGYASAALPFTAQNALSAAGVAPIRSEVEAFNSGVSSAATLGLDEVAIKQGLDATAGPAAGKAYGQHILDAREANPGFHTAGQVTGFAAMAASGGALSGAARALPGAGVSALGNVVEQGVGRALAGVAARGIGGRAVASAASLGARGAIEGTLYGAANQINEDQLGDRETTGDKLFAAAGYGALGGGLGGAVLGGGGSLASSGVKALGGVARSGISRALSRGAEVAGEAEGAASRVAAAGDEAVAKVGAAADEAVAGAKKAVTEGVASTEGAEVGLLEKYTSKDALKGRAQEQAWRSIGGGNGLQSTSFAKSAERYLPNGVKDIGEVMLRKGVINAEEGWLNAATHGAPADMLPKLEAELQIAGKQIGDMTAASPATIDGMAIGRAVNEIAGKYEQSAATRSLGTSLRRFGGDLYETLGLAERESVPIQDLIRERKALDHMVFENASLDPALSVQVKRELRGKLEGLIIDGLDEASGKVPGEQAAAYKALKHDYTALSIATDAAEDSAARMAKAATFGLTDTLRGGGSIIKTIGSKLVRERGNAAAAVLLSRMADMGTITQAVKGVDEQIARASRGLLEAPKAHALEAPAGTIHERAEKVMRAVADFQANPEAHAAAITQRTDALATTTPELAGIVSQRMTSAMAFLSSKVPVAADPDPFDPHGAPKLNDGQAAELAAYGWYIEKPSRFFDEVEHGKITFEGVEVAKLTMPRAFAQLQQETAAALAETLATPGKLVPYEQQRRLGSLLEFPATPDQRPQHMTFLQANVAPVAPAGKMTQGVASAPKRPLKLASQQSSLDRLSQTGPGRR